MKNKLISNKIRIPGISIHEILEYEEIFPDLIININKIAYISIILGQTKIYSEANTTSNNLSTEESIKRYRKMLGKSEFSTYVQSVVAIKRTIAAYSNCSDEKEIIADHYDLYSNLKGKSSLKTGQVSIFKGPEELRTYRRGIMQSISSQLQSVPLKSPRKLCTEISKITPDNFTDYLPYNNHKISIEEIINELNKELNGVNFTDRTIPNSKSIQNNLLPLEIPLGIQRNKINIPEPKIESNKIPFWKQQAQKQITRYITNG